MFDILTKIMKFVMNMLYLIHCPQQSILPPKPMLYYKWTNEKNKLKDIIMWNISIGYRKSFELRVDELLRFWRENAVYKNTAP